MPTFGRENEAHLRQGRWRRGVGLATCWGVFFVLSKLLDVALSPLAWAMLLAAAGALARRTGRGERLARVCPVVGLATLYVFSIEPVANGLWRALEAGAPSTVQHGGDYDVVVVLGGLVDDRAMALHPGPSYNDNVERLLAARDVALAGRARWVLLSGGDANPQGGAVAPEAVVLARQLEAWGVEPGRLVIEDRSRNTRENAVEAARIAAERGWGRVMLVTSAFHMKRALGCFRAVGMSPDAMPVDYRSHAGPYGVGSLLPRTGSLNTSAVALREFFGRGVYRARGYAVAID